MQHQKEVEELKEKFESANSARERDREENKKQIEKMRDEFQSTLQQQIQLALQQVITFDHGSPFIGSSILANIPCLGLCRLSQDSSTPQKFQAAQVSTTTSSHHNV